jgi:orotate phosphoribosyltransferase-like protein
MGYFSQLALDVEEMLFDGLSVTEIAQKLNISVEQVEACIEDLESADIDFDEPDFEDDGDALASAGFGTDEDYGYYGEEY